MTVPPARPSSSCASWSYVTRKPSPKYCFGSTFLRWFSVLKVRTSILPVQAVTTVVAAISTNPDHPTAATEYGSASAAPPRPPPERLLDTVSATCHQLNPASGAPRLELRTSEPRLWNECLRASAPSSAARLAARKAITMR